MKKSSLLFLLVLLLAACSTTEDDAAPTSTTEDESTMESSLGEAALSDEEAAKIAENVLSSLVNAVYPMDVGDYDLAGDTTGFDEATWAEIDRLQLEMQKQYATDAFIASNLQVDEETCGQECFIQIPMELYFTWKPTVKVMDAKQFQSIALVPPMSVVKDGEFDSHEQVVHFVLEDDLWKVDRLEYHQKDLNLQLEDAEIFLSHQAFSNITIDGSETEMDVNGVMEKAYPFTDHDMDMTYALIARTGYVAFTGSDGEVVYDDGRGDYSINNEEDYMVYNLFYEWSQALSEMEIASPEVNAFIDQLHELEISAFTARDADDEERLSAVVQGIITLSSQIDDFYYEQMNEEERLGFESEQRAWFMDMTRYFEEFVPDDTEEIDRLLDEAMIRLSNAFGVIVIEESK